MGSEDRGHEGREGTGGRVGRRGPPTAPATSYAVSRNVFNTSTASSIFLGSSSSSLFSPPPFSPPSTFPLASFYIWTGGGVGRRGRAKGRQGRGGPNRTPRGKPRRVGSDPRTPAAAQGWSRARLGSGRFGVTEETDARRRRHRGRGRGRGTGPDTLLRD